MYDFIDDNFLVALIGLATGLLLGLAARIGRFCTMGAIEDALYGASWVRMRMWFLAIGVAVTGVYALTATGHFAPEQSFYLSIRWMPLASVIGGLMFGYGMALAGNCGYGCIARLGGGDIRAFVIVVVMGVSAYAMLHGPFSYLRNWAFLQEDVTTGLAPGLVHLVAQQTGWPLAPIGILAGAVITLGALWSRSF